MQQAAGVGCLQDKRCHTTLYGERENLLMIRHIFIQKSTSKVQTGSRSEWRGLPAAGRINSFPTAPTKQEENQGVVAFLLARA